MARSSLVMWGLFATGCAAGLGYSYATRPRLAQPDAPAAQTGENFSAQAPGDSAWKTAAEQAVPGQQPAVAAPGSQPVSSSRDPVLQLAAQATGNDSKLRAEAIVALANEPPMQAISVLQEVLRSGAPSERRLALASLREMALSRGDPDVRIRNAIRYEMQDADAQFVSDAQTTLAELDAHAMQDGPVRPR